jgi:hypothetical protein
MPNDKWNDLPDVVAQLQAEASSASPRPPRLSPHPRPAAAPPACARSAAPADVDWSARLTSDDDRTILRPAPAAPAPVVAAAAAAPELEDDVDDDEGYEDGETTSPGWKGVPDYEQLLADPAPDPRALFARIITEADEALGPRARVLGPMFAKLGGKIDELLSDPGAPPSVQAERRAAIGSALDKLEDLFSALMVIQ